MRTLFITLAAAASAVAVASPAAAQWAPPVPQGYAYGYGNGQGDYRDVRRLQLRVEQLRQKIYRLASRSQLNRRQAGRLDAIAIDLHRSIQRAAARGLTWRERAHLDQRIERLRQTIQSRARNIGPRGWDGRDRYGYYGARVRDGDRRWDRDDDDDDDDDDRDGRWRDRDD